MSPRDSEHLKQIIRLAMQLEQLEQESVRGSPYFHKPLLCDIQAFLSSNQQIVQQAELVKLLLSFRLVVLKGFEKDSQIIFAKCLQISVAIFDTFTLSDASKIALGLFQSNLMHKDHLTLKLEFFSKLQILILSPLFD